MCLACLAAYACAKSDVDNAPTDLDAGIDATAPSRDAGDGGREPLVGTVCGDRTGLEEGSGWPALGGCAKRASFLETQGPFGPTSFDVASVDGGVAPVVRKDGAVAFVDGHDLVIEAGGVLLERLNVGRTITHVPVLLEDARVLLVLESRTLTLFDRKLAVRVQNTSVQDAGSADAEAGASDASAPGPVAAEWSLDLGGAASEITFAKNMIYATVGSELLAIVMKASAPAWRVPLGAPSGLAVAITGGGLAVATTRTGHITFVGARGEIVGTTDVGAPVSAPATLSKDDVLCVGDQAGRVHLFTKDRTIADVDVGAPVTTACAQDGFGTVFVGAGAKLYAVDRDGTVRFVYATNGALAPPVIGSNGVVYAASADGHAYAIDEGGLLVWAATLRSPVTVAPALGPGRALHVMTARGLTTVGP